MTTQMFRDYSKKFIAIIKKLMLQLSTLSKFFLIFQQNFFFSEIVDDKIPSFTEEEIAELFKAKCEDIVIPFFPV